MDLVCAKAGAIGFNEEPADTAVFVVHPGPDYGDVGDVAGCNPHFFAVQNVLIADLARGGGHAAGIRSETWLGESKAAELFSGREGRKPGALLFFRAEG